MAYREFRDDVGTAWTVWDTYPQSAHRISMATLRGGWLTFESRGERRRLVPAPVGWFEEAEERLRHWLAVAETAKPRLADYEARTAQGAFAVPVEAPGEPGARFQVPRVTEDLRSLIERSRQTLDELDRAIEAKSAPMVDPSRHRRT